MGALQSPYQWTTDTLGAPSASVCVTLLSVPELGYDTTYDPPASEILIRGDPVSSGYYLNEAETSAAFIPGGWFRTGDVGTWDKNGHLKIIDRVKNLIKVSSGEYVALEKLESVYRTCNIVSNICVYASGEYAKPVAVVLLLPAALGKLNEQGVDGVSSLDELVRVLVRRKRYSKNCRL